MLRMRRLPSEGRLNDNIQRSQKLIPTSESESEEAAWLTTMFGGAKPKVLEPIFPFWPVMPQGCFSQQVQELVRMGWVPLVSNAHLM